MDRFRISVKKEENQHGVPGRVSNFLHDKVHEGDEIEVGMPCGTFLLKDNKRPIVFLGGGVGFTPLLSMLETLVVDNSLKDSVTFIHCVKSADEHILAKHLDKMIEDKPNFKAVAFYSRPTESTMTLNNVKVQNGRIKVETFKEILETPPENYQYYICGPKSFIEALLAMLKALKVPQDQVMYEYFGPQLQ